MNIIISIVYGIVVIATLCLVFWKGTDKVSTGQCLKENILTGLLGLALWLEGGIIVYYAITRSKYLFTNDNAKINTLIFIALSLLLGSAMVLYATVKKVYIQNEKVVYIDLFGRVSEMNYDDIKKVYKSTGKRLAVENKAGDKIVVGGQRKQLKKALKTIHSKLPKYIDLAGLKELELSL